MPNIERIDNEDWTTTISIHIPKAEFAPTIEKELKKLRNNVAMKGFRPGQTPMPLVKKFYGQRLLIETLNNITVKELDGYLREAKIGMIFQPIPTTKGEDNRFDINELSDYTFHFDLARQPIFEIKGLSKTDKYERLVPQDLASLIEEDVKYARRRMGERSNPTDGIQDDDVVKIASVELNGDGTKREGGIATTMSCFIQNISSEAFKTMLLTKKTGDSFQFDPHDLDTWKDEKLYRKYMLNIENVDDNTEISNLFEGTVEEVSRLVTAELNQEFYDKYFGEGIVSSDEEAQEKFGENIKRHYGTQADALLLREIQTKLMDLNEIPLPTDFIKRYIALNQEDGKNIDPASLDEAMPGLLKTFRWDLIRTRIEDEAGIEVTEDEIKAAFVVRVKSYFQGQNMNLPDTFFDSTAERLMGDKEQRKDARESILYDKLFKEMAARVTVIDKPVPSEVITEQIKSANAQAGVDEDDEDLMD